VGGDGHTHHWQHKQARAHACLPIIPHIPGGRNRFEFGRFLVLPHWWYHTLEVFPDVSDFVANTSSVPALFVVTNFWCPVSDYEERSKRSPFGPIRISGGMCRFVLHIQIV
jgi:hypothetical protein